MKTTRFHAAVAVLALLAFAPSEREIAAAEALVAAATGGAQRHAGRMIEDMHVAAARALLARAGR